MHAVGGAKHDKHDSPGHGTSLIGYLLGSMPGDAAPGIVANSQGDP